MKNRLLSLLLTLSLLLSLMPTAVFAADASTLTVVINDVHVVEDGRTVAAMPSGVRYSETTNTLTLDDADLGMLRVYGGSLTIALEGDSTVHNDGSYVYRLRKGSNPGVALIVVQDDVGNTLNFWVTVKEDTSSSNTMSCSILSYAFPSGTNNFVFDVTVSGSTAPTISSSNTSVVEYTGFWAYFLNFSLSRCSAPSGAW